MPIKYTKEILEPAVASSQNYSGVIRYLGLKWAGGTQANIVKRIKLLGLNTSHFLGQASRKGSVRKEKKTPDQILVKSTTGRREKGFRLRRALIESGRGHFCSSCSQSPTWCGEKLVLEVDHINEDSLDNRAENLQFLCPNCHAQKTERILKDKVRLRHVERLSKEENAPNSFCETCNNGFWTRRQKARFCSKRCAAYSTDKRKVPRPSKEVLAQEIIGQPMTTLGKKYGVSDTAVRKWARSYGLIPAPTGS